MPRGRWGLVGAVALLVGACSGAHRPVNRGPCHLACLRMYPALVGSAPVEVLPNGQHICVCWYTEVGTTVLSPSLEAP
jgi:hypothetical protein